MGVNHLHQHAAEANTLQNNSGAPDSKVISTPMGSRPAPTSGANKAPKVGAVSAESNKALRPGMAPGHPESGGRAGAKSGNGKLGGKGPAHPLSGGRLG